MYTQVRSNPLESGQSCNRLVACHCHVMTFHSIQGLHVEVSTAIGYTCCMAWARLLLIQIKGTSGIHHAGMQDDTQSAIVDVAVVLPLKHLNAYYT